MAKAGIYKSDVRRARDTLLAQGKHPSVDAVRIALGNTGSKTTIHKYLKELEAEDGGSAHKASISEALQDLVERLAARLHDEAELQIAAARDELAAQVQQHRDALADATGEIAQLQAQLAQVNLALDTERRDHAALREAAQQEAIARHTAEQQVANLQERLAENTSHCRSLEEKHQHARDALDHYRQSVKEQREQDARRHEEQLQQVQAELRTVQQTIVVKQDDITRLNQEGVRLVAELSHAQQALREEQERGRRLASRVEALQAAEQRCGILEARAVEREMTNGELARQVAAATTTMESLAAKLHAAQLELAAARAATAAQQEVVAALRADLAPRERQTTGEPQ